MPTSLATLATLVGGRLVAAGDANLQISGAATLDEAQAGEITIVDNVAKAARLARSPASAVVVQGDFISDAPPAILVDDAHRAFSTILSHFRPAQVAARIGISSAALVSSRARLGADVDVHPGASIGDDVEIGPHSTIHSGACIMAGCKLGAGVTVFPNAVIYEGTIVGDRVIIHAGAVLGAYGFGYKVVDGRHQLAAQLGHVEVGNDVEIGACTTIDRGTYSATVIGEGTKIDNQVMIAHNCRIGRHNLICAQVGIAGSSSTGDYAVMAGQVGIKDHVHIGAGAVLGAQAGIITDVPDGANLWGSPAGPVRDRMQQVAIMGRLPEMRRQLRELQRTLDELTAAPAKPHDQAAA